MKKHKFLYWKASFAFKSEIKLEKYSRHSLLEAIFYFNWSLWKVFASKTWRKGLFDYLFCSAFASCSKVYLFADIGNRLKFVKASQILSASFNIWNYSAEHMLETPTEFKIVLNFAHCVDHCTETCYQNKTCNNFTDNLTTKHIPCQ